MIQKWKIIHFKRKNILKENFMTAGKKTANLQSQKTLWNKESIKNYIDKCINKK